MEQPHATLGNAMTERKVGTREEWQEAREYSF
jgi:hypothetical protein